MGDLIDFAEKAGLENIKFRLQNAEALAKEATTTLSILMAGMAGAMAYAIRGLEQATFTALTIGAVGLAIWLMFDAVLLVVFCMLTTNLEAPTNEPMNLYKKDYSLEIIREVELRNLQVRIKLISQRNHRVAAWLDRTRLLAIASPLPFAITALAWAAR